MCIYTDTVHPQHLQCIYSTCYSYCLSTTSTVCIQHLLHLLCICRFTVTIFPPSGKYWHLSTFLEKINRQIKSQCLTFFTIIELSVKITDYMVYVSPIRISRYCEPLAGIILHSLLFSRKSLQNWPQGLACSTLELSLLIQTSDPFFLRPHTVPYWQQFQEEQKCLVNRNCIAQYKMP